MTTLFASGYNKQNRSASRRLVLDEAQAQTDFLTVARSMFRTADIEDVTFGLARKFTQVMRDQLAILEKVDPTFNQGAWIRFEVGGRGRMGESPVPGYSGIRDYYEKNTELVKGLAKAYPDKGIKTWDELSDLVAAEAGQARAKAERDAANAPPSDRFWGTLAGMGAAIMTRDPVVLATLPVSPAARGTSAAGKIFSAAWREAAIIGGVEATVIQPNVYLQKRSIDSPYTLQDAAQIILMVSGATFVLRGAFQSIGELSKKRKLTIDVNVPQNLSDVRKIAKEKRALGDAGDRQAAIEADILDDYVDQVEKSPGKAAEDVDRHFNNMDQAYDDLADGRVAEGIDDPKVDFVDYIEGETGQRPILESVDPRTVEVDADVFQFKSKTDAHGVSDRLKGVDRWDPIQSGTVVIYETKAGKRIIVDGHQRLALAKKMIESGQPADEVRLNSYVFRETERITPEYVMQLAARKNIAEGTGTALDAAKIIRSTDPALERVLPTLPPNSALVRDAKALAKLEDEAFDYVANTLTDEQMKMAAIVGDIIEGGPEQLAAIRELLNAGPTPLLQAKLMVQQMKAVGFRMTETQDLFGGQTFAESLIKERARIMESAIKRLKRDKQTFKVLEERAEAITEAGNVLERQGNKARLSEDEKAIEIITKTVNTRGPVSDALNDAAERLKDGEGLNTVTSEFLKNARKAPSRGDTPRRMDGGTGSTTERGGDPLPGRTYKVGDELPVSKFDDLPDDIKKPAVRPPVNDPAYSIKIIEKGGEKKARVQINRDLVDPDAAEFSYPDLKPVYEGEVWQLEKKGHDLLQETDYKYKNQNTGKYKSHRSRWHNKEVKKFLDKAERTSGEKVGEKVGIKGLDPRPVAVLMGGGGASGKGTILRIMQKAEQTLKDGYVLINPDAIKELIPEYIALLRAKDHRAAQVVHEESSDIAKLLQKRAISERKNMVIDKTMGDEEKGLALIKSLKDAGYDVHLVGVTLDPGEALIRALERYYGSSRLPAREAMLEAHKGFNAAFETYQAVLEKVFLFDNSSKDALLIVRKTLESLDILDKTRYRDVGKRGQLNVKAKTHNQLRESQQLDQLQLNQNLRGQNDTRPSGDSGRAGMGGSGKSKGTGVPSGADHQQRLDQILEPDELQAYHTALKQSGDTLEIEVGVRLEDGEIIPTRKPIKEVLGELDEADRVTDDLFSCMTGGGNG